MIFFSCIRVESVRAFYDLESDLPRATPQKLAHISSICCRDCYFEEGFRVSKGGNLLRFDYHIAVKMSQRTLDHQKAIKIELLPLKVYTLFHMLSADPHG